MMICTSYPGGLNLPTQGCQCLAHSEPWQMVVILANHWGWQVSGILFVRYAKVSMNTFFYCFSILKIDHLMYMRPHTAALLHTDTIPDAFAPRRWFCSHFHVVDPPPLCILSYPMIAYCPQQAHLWWKFCLVLSYTQSSNELQMFFHDCIFQSLLYTVLTLVFLLSISWKFHIRTNGIDQYLIIRLYPNLLNQFPTDQQLGFFLIFSG